MRSLTFILFTIITLNLFSQDYRLISPNKEVHFNTNSILTLKIDSNFISGTDTTYFNHKALVVDYIIYPCSGRISDTSWVGYGITVQQNGDYIFRNIQNEPILIKSTALLNDSWVLYTFLNGDYIEAKITSILQETVLGNIDSVKTITLQAKNSLNSIITHAVNGTELKLSKYNGIIKLYAFKNFPNTLTSCVIVGSSNPNNGVVNLTAADVYNFDIGDIFHTIQEYQEPYSWYFTYHRQIINVIGKTISVNQDTLSYLFDRKLMTIKNVSYTVYNPDTTYIFDTIPEVVILSQNTHINKFTQEPNAELAQVAWGFSGYLNAYINSATQRREKEIYPYLLANSDSCWETMIDGPTRYYQYIDGLGGGYYDDFDFNNRFKLVYYEKGTETWGTPLSIINTQTSIDDFSMKNLSVNVYPNPITNYATITIKGYNSTEKLSFKLYNILGKEVYSTYIYESNFILNRNSLTSGVYFYTITNDNKNSKYSGKLIIE
ncbi:MAG TPA: T9SS type A sorting domain-containing protein [Vicingus sp.]|nr:T9SS type A sorting domain-containing protein [Vicingus sp.]